MPKRRNILIIGIICMTIGLGGVVGMVKTVYDAYTYDTIDPSGIHHKMFGPKKFEYKPKIFGPKYPNQYNKDTAIYKL